MSFVAAVETGSFAAAAERLHVTRSAVAKTIARMEARLNVRLLHRTTRSLALTEDGQGYYEHCLRAVEELRAGESALESGRREAAGRLRVSVPMLFGKRCVAPVLARLAAEHPRLELDLSFSDRQVDLIEDGFDLAIRNGEIGDGTGLMTPDGEPATHVGLRFAGLSRPQRTAGKPRRSGRPSGNRLWPRRSCPGRGNSRWAMAPRAR